jgi:hypothetical protein
VVLLPTYYDYDHHYYSKVTTNSSSMEICDYYDENATYECDDFRLDGRSNCGTMNFFVWWLTKHELNSDIMNYVIYKSKDLNGNYHTILYQNMTEGCNYAPFLYRPLAFGYVNNFLIMGEFNGYNCKILEQYYILKNNTYVEVDSGYLLPIIHDYSLFVNLEISNSDIVVSTGWKLNLNPQLFLISIVYFLLK